MAEVRKEVGDKYNLPACTFTAPENKRFKEWKILTGNVAFECLMELEATFFVPEEALVIEAVYETIPRYSLLNPAALSTSVIRR